MKNYGEKGASANMAICEVLKIHVVEDIFSDGIIDPQKIDLIGRMSGNNYCRASGSAIFEVEKPNQKKGIGFDTLPDFMKESEVYTANNLGRFAGVEIIPNEAEVTEFINSLNAKTENNFEDGLDAFNSYQKLADYQSMMKAAIKLSESNNKKTKYLIEVTAKCALENNDIDFAWKAALFAALITN